MGAEYYIMLNGERSGPFSARQIVADWIAQKIDAAAKVAAPYDARWTPIDEFILAHKNVPLSDGRKYAPNVPMRSACCLCFVAAAIAVVVMFFNFVDNVSNLSSGGYKTALICFGIFVFFGIGFGIWERLVSIDETLRNKK